MRIVSSLSCALMVLALSTPAQAQAGFDAGLDAYADGLYAEAARHWTREAEQGDARSAFNVAVLYEHGKGVEQDVEQAVVFYNRAAKTGFVDAQFSLANILLVGSKRVEKNVDEALMWYLQAADGGHIQSQYKLGLILTEGKLVPENVPTARTWLQLASRNGHYEAESLLHKLDRQSTNHIQSEQWVLDQDPGAWTVVLYRTPDVNQARHFVELVGLKTAAVFESVDRIHHVVSGVFPSKEGASDAIAGLPEALQLKLPTARRFDELRKTIEARQRLGAVMPQPSPVLYKSDSALAFVSDPKRQSN